MKTSKLRLAQMIEQYNQMVEEGYAPLPTKVALHSNKSIEGRYRTYYLIEAGSHGNLIFNHSSMDSRVCKNVLSTMLGICQRIKSNIEEAKVT